MPDARPGPRFDLVIFDCDGVLIDSEVIVCRILADALGELGWSIDARGVADRFVGRSTAAMLAEIEAEMGRPAPAGFADDVRARFEAGFERELRPIPGVHELLDRLDPPRCVASSSRPERLRHSLGLVGLWERFAPHVFSSTMVARGKPAPDLFLHAAAVMGAEPAVCLVIEDSLPGVRAARAAGMDVLGFTGGGHCGPGHGADLAAAGAVPVFASMAEVAGFLGAAEGTSARA